MSATSLCECGCGQETQPYRGKPVRFVRGHNRRGTGRGADLPRRQAWKRWRSMLRRCYDPTHKDYARYGGRGIQVCDEWRASFDSYLRDVGYRPAVGLTVDRIDNDGDYAPGNVRWATTIEQRRNEERHLRPTCRNGHPRTPENTYLAANGGRVCRACRREDNRRYRSKEAVS